MVRECVDQGHYECREVPCEEGLFSRMGKHLRHRHGCECEESCAPPTKTVQVWCPNKVWVERPVTRNVTKCEYVPTEVQVTVNKCVPQQQTFNVTVNKCVPVEKTETFTVQVPHQVAYEATRMVCRTVPTEEAYTACRMVPHTVAREVPCESECGGGEFFTASSKHGGRLGGLFGGHGGRRHGHGGDCCE